MYSVWFDVIRILCNVVWCMTILLCQAQFFIRQHFSILTNKSYTPLTSRKSFLAYKKCPINYILKHFRLLCKYELVLTNLIHQNRNWWRMMFSWGDKSVFTISILPLYVNNDPEGDEYYKCCIYLHLLLHLQVYIWETCKQTQYFFWW